jgi:hypothetical protein
VDCPHIPAKCSAQRGAGIVERSPLDGRTFRLLHCFPDRETAYYFSLTSYTTVGFGDVVISHPWRLMGGLEAINGVLMFGWSTASLVAFVFRLRETRVKLSMVSF